MKIACDAVDIKDPGLISKLTSNRTGKMKDYVAIYLVSVGKDNFENNAVEAAIKMINEEFKECYIIIADTLQRHNIFTENDVSHKIAYEQALENGDKWIKKYSEIFKQFLSIPYCIIRWDNLINNYEFEAKKSFFSSYIKESVILSTAMGESIAEYGNRLRKRIGEEYFQKITYKHKENCFDYLQEECVVISILPKLIDVKSHPPYVIVYPGKSTEILNANREIFIKNEYANMLENYNDFLDWVPFRFNKVKTDKKSHVIKLDNVDYINYLEDLKKIQIINEIAEKQLKLIGDILDEESLFKFKNILLENLLINKENTFFDIKIFFNNPMSTEYLADIFTKQLLTTFSIIEKKLANKCKANIIKILKKDIYVTL